MKIIETRDSTSMPSQFSITDFVCDNDETYTVSWTAWISCIFRISLFLLFLFFVTFSSSDGAFESFKNSPHKLETLSVSGSDFLNGEANFICLRLNCCIKGWISPTNLWILLIGTWRSILSQVLTITALSFNWMTRAGKFQLDSNLWFWFVPVFS